MQALRQIEQKSSQALFGPSASEKSQRAVITYTVPSDELVCVMLQGIDLAREVLNLPEGHSANFGVFQRDSVTGMGVVDDAIQTDDFTRHLETRDLIAAIFRGDTSFEKTRSNRIQMGKFFSVVKQRFSTFDLASGSNDTVNPLQLFLRQTDGHAELAHVAVGARNFECFVIHGLHFHIF